MGKFTPTMGPTATTSHQQSARVLGVDPHVSHFVHVPLLTSGKFLIPGRLRLQPGVVLGAHVSNVGQDRVGA